MARIVGNDVADFQGQINFDIYKNNSNFLITKATEGTGFTANTLKRNQSESRRVGLPLGYYHFARPDVGNTPEAEADYFLSKLGELKEGELLVLDYEPPNQKQTDVDWCRKWLDRVASKTNGTKPLIYLNQSQIKQFNWQTVIDGGYGLWIAAYTYDPNNNTFDDGEFPFAAMQQWTNKQQIPGIPSLAVDGNVFFGDVATFKKYGYKLPAPAPTPIDYKALYDAEVIKNNDLKNQLAAANTKNAELQSKIDKAKADLA